MNESERLAAVEQQYADLDLRVLGIEGKLPRADAPSPETPEAIAERVVIAWRDIPDGLPSLRSMIAACIRADRVRRTVGPEYDAEGVARGMVLICPDLRVIIAGRDWLRPAGLETTYSEVAVDVRNAIAAALRSAHAAGAAGRAIKGESK